MASAWATDVSELEAEGNRLFPGNFLILRYEDLLSDPFEEMSKMWRFLGAKRAGVALEQAVTAEMASNPDEEWQTRRNEHIAAFLTKGQTGNWRTLFSAADKALFKQIAGEALIRWGYEASNDW